MASVDRYDDEPSDTRLPKIVMAAANVSQYEAFAQEGRQDFLPLYLGKAGQPTATWRSISSTGPGTGIPSFSAASK